MEKTPDKDDRDLFDIPDPQPENKEGDEGRGGHVSNEAHHRFRESLRDLEGSHDQTDGDSDDRRDDESHHHSVHAVEDIGGEPHFHEEINTRLEDPSWRGKKQGVDKSPVGEN